VRPLKEYFCPFDSRRIEENPTAARLRKDLRGLLDERSESLTRKPLTDFCNMFMIALFRYLSRRGVPEGRRHRPPDRVHFF